MKLFRLCPASVKNRSWLFWVFLCIGMLLESCASISPQYGKKPGEIKDDFNNASTVSHSFYLIGDAGNWDQPQEPAVFSLLKDKLNAADSTSTLIFLGDNIYPLGMPKPGDKDYESAVRRLKIQTDLAKDFKGKSFFIPGNHDWYHELAGLNAEEKAVVDVLGKKGFLPRKGCGITDFKINEQTAVIVIDTEWFLQDWDDHPAINADCDIKTRDMFWAELENKINDYQNQTLIIAMHHPLFTYGPHGGYFSPKKHLYPLRYNVPLPGIATIMNLMRKTSGVSPEDLQNKKYNAFIKRFKISIQGHENIIVVSGHEHNLQYIEKDGIKQVVSGSGSKSEPARVTGPKDFSSGSNGFAVLKVLKNGAAGISYFSPDSNQKDKILFSAQPVFERPQPTLKKYPDTFAATKDTSVYTLKMTQRSGIYRFFWGKHYRKYYSMNVNVPQVSLDTLFGGVKPIQAGGGNQSKSLRLTDAKGREYSMRSLRKSATRFLQAAAFKDLSVEKDFQNTYTETFLMDFYTTAHPYTPFAVANLAGYVGVNHTNPKLFYIPKQNTLELYNEDYGDELYLVEERPMDKFKDLASFGKPDDIISTNDMLANLRDNPKYSVDKEAYIRARLFDMLIGDWDRHSDQWRWAEHKEKGKIIYKPIPRDRDQAFTKIDGALLSILMNIPAIRHMKKYKDEIKNVKWFNRSAYNLDLAVLPDATESDWAKQANYITENLSDDEIEKSFNVIPSEVRDQTIATIKSQLKSRRKDLEKYARQYYKVLLKTVMIPGSEKPDHIVVTRTSRETKVEYYVMSKDGSEQKALDRTYTTKETKEIWIYGLGGEDKFEVKGRGNKMEIRLLGGPDKDEYVCENGRNIHIYDFKSKDNDYSKAGSASKTITDDYVLNTYDYKKPKYNVFAGYPLMGFNPDDGVKIGAFVNYTVNGFKRNPYSQRHSIGGYYYFATSGYELLYNGIFPNALGNWNFQVKGRFTSANFAQNFFGFGNETPNYDDDRGMNYNRVKIRSLSAAPTLQWKGEQGASATFQAAYERFAVARRDDRFIGDEYQLSPEFFEYKDFADFNAEYRFENYDNAGFPTAGMLFYAKGGYKIALQDGHRSYPYAESAFGMTYKLSPSGRFVLASMVKGKMLFENTYEFYQAATVGGDADLRGYRNQRFAGRSSFYHTTDLRWNMYKWKTPVAPLNIGVLAGFDYGRVWLSGEQSDKWHSSAGMGLWVSALNLVTGRVSYFQSGDGGRLFVGVGFGF
ncbi:metallophosphoesterase [Flavobacterium silvaticum]|uniref:Metallophosphoesterase n=1 Tax=Flavobacterium silvaticum TaxID=1852020 RepID=A0A972FSB6_9FLAO|nr:metallophosphoesterase [Flavobacterium silvaticum]NMH27593.1 metallophosphoesterase [Flavobacterium silvaticum]